MKNWPFYRSLHARGWTAEKLARAIGSSRAHVTEVLGNKPGHGGQTRRKLVPFLTDEELRNLGLVIPRHVPHGTKFRSARRINDMENPTDKPIDDTPGDSREAARSAFVFEDYDIGDEQCEKCRHPEVRRRDCPALDCEDGYYHDCMEDCCCCAEPTPNRRCDECGGHGVVKWCPRCGWEPLLKSYMNGVDQRLLGCQPANDK